MTDHLDHLLETLPRATLSVERDRRIRAAILAPPTLPVETDMPRLMFRFPKFAFALAAIVAVVGVSGYAYASPSVTRGDALYPVKRALERAKGSTARTPLERVTFHATLSLRRAGELDVLLQERSGARTALLPVAHAQDADPAAATDTTATPADATAPTETTTTPEAPATTTEPAADATGEPTEGTKGGGDVSATEDPIVATADEVATEVTAAADAAEEITDPTVADAALAVLAVSQGEVATVLEDAANAAGTEDLAITEAIAEAIETTTDVAAATDAAAEEVATATETGDTTVALDLVAEDDGAAAAAADEDDGADEEEPSEVERKLAEQRAGLEELRAQLTAAGVPSAQADRLTARVATKLDKVAAAIASGNEHQAKGLLKASKALTNNAKHFFKETARGDRNDDDADDEDADAGEDADGQLTICHRPPGNVEKARTITIGAPAWRAHEAHGDTREACPPPPADDDADEDADDGDADDAADADGDADDADGAGDRAAPRTKAREALDGADENAGERGAEGRGRAREALDGADARAADRAGADAPAGDAPAGDAPAGGRDRSNR